MTMKTRGVDTKNTEEKRLHTNKKEKQDRELKLNFLCYVFLCKFCGLAVMTMTD